MSTRKKVLLLSNFRPDMQLSMLRFGQILTSEQLQSLNIEIEEIFPTSVFTKISPFWKLRKWAAYVDKYLLFPKRLKRELNIRKDPLHLIHIIDHSNAIYLPKLTRMTQAKKMITCHDLIAIRTAKGDFGQSPKTSKSGKRLQNWILDSLRHADYYACDSKQTLKDLNHLIPQSKEKSSVLHLGTETGLTSISVRENLLKKLPFDPVNTRFLLHVGSAAWYKNRKAALCSFIHARRSLPEYDLKLVLVGPEPQKEELDEHLSNWIKSHPSVIFSLQNLPENVLAALYKYAKALVSPSFIEGFGWPPIEASTKKCPVICSRVGALGEILEDTAIFIDPENQNQINHEVINLLKGNKGQRIISNTNFPSLETCKANYAELYEKIISNNHLIALE